MSTGARRWPNAAGAPRSAADVDREIADEFEFHIAMIQRELERRGVAPDKAERESRRRFGNANALHRQCRRIALGERAMLQRINLVLLVLIIAVLTWICGVQASQRRLLQIAVDRAERQMELEAQRAFHSGTVYVEGTVVRPGAYALSEKGLTLRQLLAAAGGVKGDFSQVQIAREQPNGLRAIRFTLTPADWTNPAGPDEPVKAYDIVRVE